MIEKPLRSSLTLAWKLRSAGLEVGVLRIDTRRGSISYDEMPLQAGPKFDYRPCASRLANSAMVF